MASKFTRLHRESDPPAGKAASPTPQYWDRVTEQAEDVEGLGGAPGAVLFGPDGTPVSQANPLEVRVRELEAKLTALQTAMTDGSQKAQLTGTTMELYVTDWGNLPDANSVPLGATAQLIGTFDVRQSDGTGWAEVVL